jgi:DNA-directed RNA polymerase subunit H (RpoH/RPB5)
MKKLIYKLNIIFIHNIMSSDTDLIKKAYGARSTLIDILERLNFNTTEYSEFQMHEVQTMYTNDQLDMLLHNDNKNKIYVKWCLNLKTIKTQNIETFVEDLFTIEEILEQKDTLMIIMKDTPNDTIKEYIKHLYSQTNIFIVIHSLSSLGANILDHSLNPKVHILNDEERNEISEKYNIKNFNQLSTINRFDPLAMAICMKPGDVAKFVRHSVTAIETDYYRICVNR